MTIIEEIRSGGKERKMTNKEAIEILKESANRNKVALETLIDMMSSDTLEWVVKETEALTKAIELLEAQENG